MDLSRRGHTRNHTGPHDSSDDDANETTPQLVYQSKSTAIYRLKDIGTKVLVDPNPSEKQILQMMHEHNVSKFLPSTCRKRHVIDVKGFKGDPAVYFQWARGETLTQWLAEAQQRSDVDLNVRLLVAIAITETMFKFHDGGVVYNSLSPNNIVLDMFEGSYVATFIDLSEAMIFYNKDDEFARTVGETDLKCLGVILKELFHTGNDDASANDDSDNDGENETCRTEEIEGRIKDELSTRRKRGRRQSPGDDLPMYLGTLISTLLLSGEVNSASSSQARYENTKDVLFDLRVVNKNPQVFLKPLILDDYLAQGRLQLPADAFYGRQSEMSMLLHSLKSVTTLGGQPMMVSISGYPGMGKTALVNQIKKPLQNVKGHFVSGKFDDSARSDSVIFSALDTFYSDIIGEAGENIQREMRSRILKNVGSGCRFLMKSIPGLQTFLEECYVENTETAFSPTATEQRWKYLLCKLVAATSNEDCPLVLFLDDLQWADETSLDVIRMIVTDPDIRYCLFIGVHRDNQSSSTNRVKKLLHGIQEQGVSFMAMRIGPIEKESINTILSETLCLPPRLCQPLSTIIHSKTGGIALFMLDFLKSLKEEGLLWFDLSSRRWAFDTRGIEAKEISDDVVEHISKRMTRLPHEMQSGLKISACLGSSFSAGTLQKGFSRNDFDIDEFLRFAVEGGYLREISCSKYMWAHDQIQQAAYELIPVTRREAFHLLLGSRMFLSTLAEMDDDLFTIVGNMNIGIRLMKSQQQKLEVARLNLRAGEMAIASSSFNSAAEHLMIGIALLPDDSWVEEYDLTIRLYDAASEANYVTGDFGTLASIIQMPLLHARFLEDKLCTYNILVRYLIASGQLREGISKSTNVLAQLGETLPEHVDNTLYAEEVELVKRSLMDLSEDDLLNLPLMTDERKLACMQFMNTVMNAAYCVEPLLSPILVFRMVRLSIDHGVCNISTFAFGLYGAWLVSAVNSDFEGGYRMGFLAITLMNRLEANEFIPRVYTSVYGFINIWKEPFQAGLVKCLEGYDAGAMSGDTEFAVSCLFQYASCAFHSCGEDIAMLETSLRLYIRRAIQCKQEYSAKTLVVLHDLILRFMGSKEISYSIFFDTNEEAFYQEGIEKSLISLCRYILHKRKFLAFFNGDMDVSAESFEIASRYHTGANARLSHLAISTVIDGLIAFFFARKHQGNENRWRKTGEAVVNLTRQWATNSNWNFINKLYLLEAEHFFLNNEDTKATEKYKQSIKAAHDHHFIHEEGLAFERAAWFHLHYGRRGEALVSFTESKKCYEKWGARGLVNYIERTILNLF